MPEGAGSRESAGPGKDGAGAGTGEGGPDPWDGVIPLGFAHESAWVRDYGPLQVRHGGGVTWLDADYHAPRARDDAVPAGLARRFGVAWERAPYSLEGGGVAGDGRGLCAMTRASFERLSASDPVAVAERLGCPRLVVVPALSGEPTGHVDMIVQFLGPDAVAVGSLARAGPDGPDVDEVRLDSAALLLRRAAAEAGHPLEVVRVPLHRGPDGRLFSYVNLVQLEEALLVPDYRDVPAALQAEAYRVLEWASGKRIVPIPADDVALAGGGLHCIVLGLHLAGSIQPLDPTGRRGRAFRNHEQLRRPPIGPGSGHAPPGRLRERR